MKLGFSGKKGEKEIQIIFGLLILLIISLVVLNLFFKWVRIGGETLEKQLSDAEKKQAWEKVTGECISLCSKATNINDNIEYCRKVVKIDFDGDNAYRSKADYGRWEFCENTLPCFVVVGDNPQCNFNGNQCRKIMASDRPDVYSTLTSKPEGTCQLKLNSGTRKTNWIQCYGFDITNPEEAKVDINREC